jgi:hypothetical protein
MPLWQYGNAWPYYFTSFSFLFPFPFSIFSTYFFLPIINFPLYNTSYSYWPTCRLLKHCVSTEEFVYNSLPWLDEFVLLSEINMVLYSAFGKSLCTYKRCWKWCPRASIQAWTRLILFANPICRYAFGKSLCTYKKCWEWRPWASIQIPIYIPNLHTVAKVHSDFPNAL